MNFDSLMTKLIAGKAPCVVGLDIAEEELPQGFLEKHKTPVEAVCAFNRMVIDAVCETVVAVSVNVPVFLRYGKETLCDAFSYAKKKGLYVIADIKSGGDPVASASEARYYFDLLDADAVTVSPYFGMEALSPFFERCESCGKNVFVISHSESGAPRDVQELMAGMRMVYRVVCEKVNLRGEKLIGNSGYSNIGIVIGGVSNKLLAELRRTYKSTFFIITGYDGEKTSAHDLNGAFDMRGLGGLVYVSRIVTAPSGDGELSERIRLSAESVAKDLKLCF